MAEKRLTRSVNNRMVAGVAGGLAEYFDVDPTLVRALFVIVTLLRGSGGLIYIILWLIMPEASSTTGDFGDFSE
ncbi:MAG: PspC domain-containing protein [Chloroflexi bacterium]|nr:PspC domain-containing protein [Chloroflexota bacterium]